MAKTEKKEKSKDLRVVKTHKALTTALISLLKEKKFENITVQEICDVAMVRRATFYTHFSDKYELFAFTIRYLYQDFPSYKSLIVDERNRDIYRDLTEDAITFFIDNIEIVNSVLNSDLMYLMLNIISTEVTKELTTAITQDIIISEDVNMSPDLIINFYMRGMFGALSWWIKEDYPISKEELVRQVRDLIRIK